MLVLRNLQISLDNIELRIGNKKFRKKWFDNEVSDKLSFKKVRFHVFSFLIFEYFFQSHFMDQFGNFFHKSENTVAKQFYK